MPNENDKTVVETTPATPSPEQPAAATGGRKKLLLFGGIGLGAVVIGIALALFVVKPMLAPSQDKPVEATTLPADNHKASKESPETKKGHGGAQSSSLIYTIDDIVINPAGTGGSRFLSVSFGFELASEAMVIEFRAREPIIRDALITIMSSKTVAQLTDARQKEITRFQIKKRVAELMKTEQIAGVYYTDFVLQ